MAKGMKTGGRDFAKGQSGNPSGHPKGFAEVRAAARELTNESMARLAAIMRGDDDRVSLEAIKVILERGWGKPASAPEDLDAVREMAVPREKVMEALEALVAMRGET